MLSLFIAFALSAALLTQTIRKLGHDPQAGVGFILLPFYFFIVFGVTFVTLMIIQKMRSGD